MVDPLNDERTENTILIFDRHAVRRSRERAASNLSQHDFLITWAAEALADRLMDVQKRFSQSLQIGGRSSPQIILNTGKVDQLYLMDTNANSAEHPTIPFIQAEEEFFPVKDYSLDLVFSVFNLHSVNDLPGALIQIRKSLKPDGFFLAAILGGETLFELRESLIQAEMNYKGGASPRVFPFADKQQMGALLQRAGFSLPVVDSDIVTVTYENMFTLMHDIRGMGEGNAILNRDRRYTGKDFFMRAAQYYQEHFQEKDGRIRASFEVIFLAGWAPHESQQKPLKPGSAKMRLSNALNTKEIKTGDKAKP